MSELNKTVEETTEVTNEVVTTEEKKESKAKGFISKVGAGVKKHGKKALIVLGVGALGAAAFVLGKRSGNGDSDDSDYDEDDVVEVEYSEVEAE